MPFRREAGMPQVMPLGRAAEKLLVVRFGRAAGTSQETPLRRAA